MLSFISTEFIVQLCYNKISSGNSLSSGRVAIEVGIPEVLSAFLLLLQIINGKASLLHLSVSVQFMISLISGVPFYTAVSQFTINGIQSESSVYGSSSNFAPYSWSADEHLTFLPSVSGSSDTDVWGGGLYSYIMYDEVMAVSLLKLPS